MSQKRFNKKIPLGLLVLIVVYIITMALLPIPKVKIDQLVNTQTLDTGSAKQMPWPQAKQIAVGARNYGILSTQGEEESVPTASVAKAITALAIVRKHPLKPGESGPSIIITQEDVDLFNYYYLNDGSVIPVKVGQEFTEYQALQAMLIPSANNMAATMARWAFGSEEAYIEYANQMVKELGMRKTHIADPSGFSEQTVSTARDLVVLGDAVLSEPVLAEIVAQTEADLPGGLVQNVNDALGVSNINGIKTGFTGAAGGCLLFSATKDIDGVPVTVVGAILGAQTRPVAISAAPKLAATSFTNFTKLTPVKNGDTVAMAKVGWASDISIVAREDVSYVAWKGSPQEMQVQVSANTYEAKIKLGDKETVAKLSVEIPSPNFWWRISHPLEMLSLKRAQ